MNSAPRPPRIQKPIHRRVLAALGAVLLSLLLLGGALATIFSTGGIRALLRIPGVSGLLGLDRPRDLFMPDITDEDRRSLVGKLGRTPEDIAAAAEAQADRTGTGLPDDFEYRMLRLTPQELALLLEEADGPTETLSRVQVRLEKDGGMTLSGIADIPAVVAHLGYEMADVEGFVGETPDRVAVSATVSLGEDGNGSIHVLEANLGSLAVPESLLSLVPPDISPELRDYFLSGYGLDIRSLSVEDGAIVLDLGLPTAPTP